jgi:hypothetical protein
MKIGFYITEMNYRGITNSVYNFAYYNEKILKNKSFIFYNKLSNENKKNVIKTFNKRFRTYSIKNLSEIKKKEDNLDYIYFQRAGHKDNLVSDIKNIIHVVFPYSFINCYGNSYSYISSWLSKICSNKKYSFVPLILYLQKNNKLTLKKKLDIPSKSLVFGYHGGAHSFDIIFVRDAIKKIVKKNKNIYFIFLNVKKFISHKNIYFLKGHFNSIEKNKFINTCDAMIHARSLGESFGLSCGEFAIKNKPIFTYKYCRQRAHIENFEKKIFLYGSQEDLINKILNFDKDNKIYNKNFKNIYTPNLVMKKFNNTFLKNSNLKKKINIFDIISILNSYFLIFYCYVRYKIYIKYYKIFLSKI